MSGDGRAGGGPELGAKLKQFWPSIYIRTLQTFGPVTVSLVKGAVIRREVWLDFTEGGNPAAYAWLTQWPPHVIVDDANLAEWRFIELHEISEMCAMLFDHLSYEKAHIHANSREIIARRDPSKTMGLLDVEIQRFLKAVAEGRHPEMPK
jgi:hypothetical protein